MNKKQNSNTMTTMVVVAILAGEYSVFAQESSAFTSPESILEANCTTCHRPGKTKGGLDLTTREALLKGGENGAAVIPGKAAESQLYRMVVHLEEPGMPMKKDKLPDHQIAVLAEWINKGIPYSRTLTFASAGKEEGRPESGNSEKIVTDADRKHWSFTPLSKNDPPSVRQPGWVNGAIDQFILAAIEKKGLTPVAPLSRLATVRRLYLDLLGLPPTLEQVDAVMSDTSPEWYAELVDRLMSNPHFGERWGRHWLDLARYSDSDGFEGDGERPGAYHYRDFVIRAINYDMPYDRFVKLQIAGDQLAPDDADAVSATGFCSAGPLVIFTGGAKEGTPEERERLRYDQLDDMVSTTNSALLGLTAGCARCHDHKFDPLPTRDYYRMMAAFIGTENKGASYIKGFTKADKNQEIIDRDKPYSLTDQPKPVKAYLLGRGDPTKKREEISVGFLSVLSDDPTFARWTKSASGTVHPRVAMANWLCDVEHGAGRLLARVMVNRLWKHHFGEGLIRTPSDVGHQGEAPTNPQLLDWLASQLIANGWHLKSIHRQILLSSTYRLGGGQEQKAIDSAEDQLWRRRRAVRLEAEVLRDSVLAVSGQLRTDMYGPSVKTWVPPEARTGRDKDYFGRPNQDGPEQWRRSIYLFIKRSLPLPFTEVFDAPAASSSCGKRLPSTVATQALTLMNDPFIRNQAKLFAERVHTEVGDSVEAQVDRAMRLALGRLPTADERFDMIAFLQQDDGHQRLIDLCHLIFTLNEFIYVD